MGEPLRIGAYLLGEALGEGGTATVHAALRVGEGGFRRVVAVKRLRQPFARDADVIAMLLDEARLAGRIVHRNVVPTHDVVASDGELLIAMELVHGLSLLEIERLLAPAGLPLGIAVAIACEILAGLHAAHELASPSGEKLGLVHRDVSPANVLVAVDGEARIIDFGIAKAVGRLQRTRTGVLKGKLAYMAPELFDGVCDRRADIYAVSVCLWQMIAGRLPFEGDDEGSLMDEILSRPVRRLGGLVDGIPAALDAVILRGLERDPALRFATARDAADALRAAIEPAPASDVAAWLLALGSQALVERERMIADVERQSIAEPSVAQPAAAAPARVRARPKKRVARATAGPRLFLGIVALSASLALVAVVVGRTTGPADSPAPSSTLSVASSVALAPAEPRLAVSAETPGPAPTSLATTSTSRSRSPVRAHPRSHDCDVPTWVDSQGVKHYKTECSR